MGSQGDSQAQRFGAGAPVMLEVGFCRIWEWLSAVFYLLAAILSSFGKGEQPSKWNIFVLRHFWPCGARSACSPVQSLLGELYSHPCAVFPKICQTTGVKPVTAVRKESLNAELIHVLHLPCGLPALFRAPFLTLCV